ncbi:MAG: hypothetical protein WC242_01910 [Candidatus Paceibacterota bacterium]
MQTGKAIEPVAVKTFRKGFDWGVRHPGESSLDVFSEEIKKTDCQETADGLFFKMAQVRDLTINERWQRIRIYVAYANAGNKQTLVCLTHHLLEDLMGCNFGDMFYPERWSELQTEAITELLKCLRNHTGLVNPNRGIVKKFLIDLFETTRNLTIRRIVIDVFIKNGYGIDLLDNPSQEDAIMMLYDHVNTSENQNFLTEVKAVFERRLEQEQDHFLFSQALKQVRIATYLFLWTLQEEKKEKRKADEKRRRRVGLRGGGEHV